jgi:glycosyltransferase involved in cell wall biosynthesis
MKIGIVSSIDESCGNATFAQHLINRINEQGHTAIPIRLNLNLTQSLDPGVRKLADQHIKELALELKNLNGVNIQFEAGLFGVRHIDIKNRLNILSRANIKTTVTLHATRYFDYSTNSILGILKSLAQLRLRTALFEFARIKNTRKRLKENRAYVKLLEKNRVKIIVHTIKSFDAIKMVTDSSNVHVHPIKFCNPRTEIDKIDVWKSRLNLEDGDRLIGIFGFISKYKGHHHALRAIGELPPNFKLLIVGKQHPMSIREHEDIDPYLDSLISYIEDDEGLDRKRMRQKKLRDRVIFLNELSDEEFFELAASVDYAWLPYLETGQDGSGIASIVFDLSKRVIASNCKAFDELIRLVPEYKCERFDIGNYMELAHKTLNYREFRTLDNELKYSDQTQTNLYIDLLTH